MSYEHFGMGFPNDAVDLPTIFALPSSNLLMLATEARYHLGEAQQAGKRVWYRSIPNRGKRPAELKWDAKKIAAECLAQVNETASNGGTITDFIPLNELDLQDERGDSEDDWSLDKLSDHYERIGKMLADLLPLLRKGLPEGCRVWFPPFTPDHHALDYLYLWQSTAEQYDGIVIHYYDNEQQIASGYQLYRDQFPQTPLIVGEWQCKDVDEERRVLVWATNAMRNDPLFQGMFFFIWKWKDAPGWWSDAYDIEHNPDRLKLFMSPPVIDVITPPVEVPTVPPDYRQWAYDAGLQEGLDGPTFQRQIGVESWDYSEAVIACQQDSEAGAQGIAQIVQEYHPDVNPCDPQAALAYAAKLMAGYLQAYGGDYALALACYNAGPSATAKGLAGQLDGWPYNETVRYVSRILNISEEAATARLTGSVIATVTGRVFGPDVPDSITLQQNSWTCAVRSAYVDLYMLAQKGLIEPVTYGDDGPRDVYAALVPTYDDSTVGLHDGSGAQLAELITSRFGVRAESGFPVTLEQVQAHAGLSPVLIGGQAWGHWVAVRGVEDDGTLILENPAPGYDGVGNELLTSFDRLGPFAMVVLDLPPVTNPTQMEDEVKQITADALRNENAALRTIVGYLQGDVASAAQKEIDTITPSLGALQSAINTLKNTALPEASPVA